MRPETHDSRLLEPFQASLEVSVRDAQHRSIHFLQETDRTDELRQHVARLRQQLGRVAKALNKRKQKTGSWGGGGGGVRGIRQLEQVVGKARDGLGVGERAGGGGGGPSTGFDIL